MRLLLSSLAILLVLLAQTCTPKSTKSKSKYSTKYATKEKEGKHHHEHENAHEHEHHTLKDLKQEIQQFIHDQFTHHQPAQQPIQHPISERPIHLVTEQTPPTSQHHIPPYLKEPLIHQTHIHPFAQVAAPTPPRGHYFDHIFIMVFENTPFSLAMKDPHFLSFAKKGTLLTNYHALSHPSHLNYMAMICGTLDLTDTSIVDLLEKEHLTWKAYQESYPGDCYIGTTFQTYTRKHNPFISLHSIQQNRARCSKIVNATDVHYGLDADLAAGTLPHFSFYTPDIYNSGGNTGVTYAGNYLSSFFKYRLSYFPERTLILVTFDEDDRTENNHVYAVLVGGDVDSGRNLSTHYTHYSILKTIEQNWNLKNLGKGDVSANAFDLGAVTTSSRCYCSYSFCMLLVVGWFVLVAVGLVWAMLMI